MSSPSLDTGYSELNLGDELTLANAEAASSSSEEESSFGLNLFYFVFCIVAIPDISFSFILFPILFNLFSCHLFISFFVYCVCFHLFMFVKKK